MHKPLRYVTDALSHPISMLITVSMTAFWIYTDPKTWYDALLAGGAMLLAQGIYKTGEPRDKAMHKKLDSILDDPNLRGIEKDS